MGKFLFWVIFFILLIIAFIALLLYTPNRRNLLNPPRKTHAPITAKPGSCLVFEEKYCSQAELIEFNYQGKTYTYVGFRLPSGVPLLSPMDGQVAKAEIVQPSPYKGFLATVMDPNNPTSGSFGFVGDLKFPNMLSINIKKGDIIGYAQNTETENFGNYNLLVGASNSDSLRSLFPEAFKKPAKNKHE